MKTKVKDIAEHLQLKIINPNEDNDNYFRLSLSENIELYIHHDSYRNKLRCGLTYSKQSGLSYSTDYAKLFDSISLSDTRDAQSLAKDITRRILNAPERARYEMAINDSVNNMNKAKTLKLDVLQDIEAVAKVIGNFYHNGRSLDINEDYGNVEISCRRLTVEQILRIVEVIDG